MFEIREVAVQGSSAVTEVVEALRELDAIPAVDVIVIARGGGALEELLPFSNEAMVRAVAQARTPVISAIGHDVDQPLLDLVADWRASTPTDAGKKVVPDAAHERALVDAARDRVRRALVRRVEAERSGLRSLVSRPVMADPVALVRVRRQEVAALRARATTRLEARLHRAADQAEHLRRQVVALSPSRPWSGAMPSCSTATGASSWTRTTSGWASCCGSAWPGATSGCGPCRPAPTAPRRRVAPMADATTTDGSFPDIADMRYEDAREELIAIVAKLEAGQAPLEDSMQLWRRGEALAAHCATWLDGAQAEIERGHPSARCRRGAPRRRRHLRRGRRLLTDRAASSWSAGRAGRRRT